MKDRTWQVGLRLVPILNGPSFTNHPPLVLPSPPLWLWLSYSSVLLGLAFCSLCCSCTRFLYKFPTRLAFENPAHLLNRICVNNVARFRDCSLQLLVLTCGWGSVKPVTVADGDRLLQGLQRAGVLRGKGFNLFWFHMTFLFVLPHFFLWFWFVCLFEPPWYCPVVKPFWLVSPVGWGPIGPHHWLQRYLLQRDFCFALFRPSSLFSQQDPEHSAAQNSPEEPEWHHPTSPPRRELIYRFRPGCECQRVSICCPHGLCCE